MRITGMATGMDTDTLIKQMMKPYTMRVDKMKQDRQVVAWKQELYREIVTDATALKDTYLDFIKPATNMLSKDNYAAFDVTATSSIAGESARASATASVGAQNGNYTVEVVTLATPATSATYETGTSSKGITDTLGADSTTSIKFEYNDSKGVPQTATIGAMDDKTTVKQFMDKISEATLGEVNLSYSELTKKFTFKSSGTGTSSSLVVTGTGKSILTELGSANPISKQGAGGTPGEVWITPPGSSTKTKVTPASNNFSIDGVNYTINKANAVGDTTTVTNITVAANSQKTYDKILTFVDKYNQLVEKVTAKTDEKKQYKYLPLSDEEKKGMKEEEIKQWELKAKVGLLKGDSNLDNMLSEMRKAFYEKVPGAGITLTEIGLSTSADISQRGKIIIDETKLKAAIETKGEQVADLFAKQSTTHPSYSADAKSSDRIERNSEQGIFQKISDILQDYTKSTGTKGILIAKAGLKGDVKSLLSEDIIKKDKKINEMVQALAARENGFYLKFSKLEVAMNKLNSQSSWLTQQLGGGQ